MRFHDGKMAEAKKNSYSVYTAYLDGTSMLVAVPYPYNTNLTQAQAVCHNVFGGDCMVDREYCPTPQHKRDALDNTKEVYPELFK